MGNESVALGIDPSAYKKLLFGLAVCDPDSSDERGIPERGNNQKENWYKRVVS
jgi:hypothetical protein